MAQILLGAAAFALGFGFDWASWRRSAVLKPVLELATVACFLAALLWTLATPGRWGWPAWVAVVGWPLVAAGAALLAYSLFFEIPFAATYARPGSGDVLVTTGTYALVRHPGVLWLGLLLAGLALVSRGRLMLVAGAIWLLCDIVYVWLQEAFLFRRMFPGYEEYQRTTPMLVPTAQSLARCLHSLPLRRVNPPAAQQE
jgi:protein-S-isoprenylcysteine O-methyltransferase Ste14